MISNFIQCLGRFFACLFLFIPLAILDLPSAQGATAIENCFSANFDGLKLANDFSNFENDLLIMKLRSKRRAVDDDTGKRVQCPPVSFAAIAIPQYLSATNHGDKTKQANPELDLTFNDEEGRLFVAIPNPKAGQNYSLKVFYDPGGSRELYKPGGTVKTTFADGESIEEVSTFHNNRQADITGEFAPPDNFVVDRRDWLNFSIRNLGPDDSEGRLKVTVPNHFGFFGVMADGADKVNVVEGDVNTQVTFIYEYMKAGEVRYPMIDINPTEPGPGKVRARWRSPEAFDSTFGEREVLRDSGVLEPGQADLRSNIFINSDNLQVGQQASLSIVVTNVGVGTSEPVQTLARVATGLRVDSADDDAPALGGNGNFNDFGLNVSALAPGKSKRFDFTVTPVAAEAVKVIVIMTDGNNNTNNNRERFTATVVEADRELVPILPDPPPEVVFGKAVTQVFTISNDSAVEATAIIWKIDFTLLTGVAGIAVDIQRFESSRANLQTSHDGAALNSSLDRLEAGGSVDLTVTYVVTPTDFVDGDMTLSAASSVQAEQFTEARASAEIDLFLDTDPPPVRIAAEPNVLVEGQEGYYSVRLENTNGTTSSGTIRVDVEDSRAIAIPKYTSATSNGQSLEKCEVTREGNSLACPLSVEQQDNSEVEFGLIIALIEEPEPDYQLEVTITYTNEAGDSRSATTSTLLEAAPSASANIRIDPNVPGVLASGTILLVPVTVDVREEADVTLTFTFSYARSSIQFGREISELFTLGGNSVLDPQTFEVMPEQTSFSSVPIPMDPSEVFGATASTVPENILVLLESSGSQDVIITAEATTGDGETASASTTVTVLNPCFSEPDADGNVAPTCDGADYCCQSQICSDDPVCR